MSHTADVSRLGKPVKTLFGWLIFRRISRPLSIAFARLGIPPTLITFAGLAFGLSAAVVFAGGTRRVMLVGAGLAAIAKILDACDGEVARMRHVETPTGYVVDGLTDRLRDTMLLIGCAAAARGAPDADAWSLAAIAVYLGFFYVSGASPAHWREAIDARDLDDKHAFRVTRSLRLGAGDTLVVALFVVAALERPLWLLMGAAIAGPLAIAFKTRRLLAAKPWEGRAPA